MSVRGSSKATRDRCQLEQTEGAPQGTVSTSWRTSLRKRPINDTDHVIDPEPIAQNPDEVAIWGYLMTQYGLKAGLRKELTTLHVMNTWKPKHMHELSKEERAGALSSLIFIKEKWEARLLLLSPPRACF